MGLTVDLGRRIELVSMDAHFKEISIALYSQTQAQGPVYKVQTYSSLAGAAERIDYLVEAMQVLGGMHTTADNLLHFPCWAAHEFAVKRLFLEACKQDPNLPLQPKPMQITDKRSDCTMQVAGLGKGVYQVNASGSTKDLDRRISSITRGLARLGEMDMSEDSDNQASFSCGTDHNPLVGLLLVRAPNVRAAIREAEEAASRGILAAPSSQE